MSLGDPWNGAFLVRGFLLFYPCVLIVLYKQYGGRSTLQTMINAMIHIILTALIVSGAVFVVLVAAAILGQWRDEQVKEAERETLFNAFEEARKRKLADEHKR